MKKLIYVLGGILLAVGGMAVAPISAAGAANDDISIRCEYTLDDDGIRITANTQAADELRDQVTRLVFDRKVAGSFYWRGRIDANSGEWVDNGPMPKGAANLEVRVRAKSSNGTELARSECPLSFGPPAVWCAVSRNASNGKFVLDWGDLRSWNDNGGTRDYVIRRSTSTLDQEFPSYWRGRVDGSESSFVDAAFNQPRRVEYTLFTRIDRRIRQQTRCSTLDRPLSGLPPVVDSDGCFPLRRLADGATLPPLSGPVALASLPFVASQQFGIVGEITAYRGPGDIYYVTNTFDGNVVEAVVVRVADGAVVSTSEPLASVPGLNALLGAGVGADGEWYLAVESSLGQFGPFPTYNIVFNPYCVVPSEDELAAVLVADPRAEQSDRGSFLIGPDGRIYYFAAHPERDGLVDVKSYDPNTQQVTVIAETSSFRSQIQLVEVGATGGVFAKADGVIKFLPPPSQNPIAS